MLTAKKTQKSPLTYPNDRPLAVSFLASQIPEGVDSIVTPFLGGGSLELGLSARGYRVSAYTQYRLLYDFWQCIMTNPEKMYQMASTFYPIGEQKLFSVLQKKVYQPDYEYLRSSLFYVLNLCAEEGRATSGGMERGTPRFNQVRLSQLANFETTPFQIELGDYPQALDTSDFLVCSMPDYMKVNLPNAVIIPENPQINHKKFKRLLEESNSCGWALLYRYHEGLVDLYSDHQVILLGEGYRPTSNPSRAVEVMIVGS